MLKLWQNKWQDHTWFESGPVSSPANVGIEALNLNVSEATLPQEENNPIVQSPSLRQTAEVIMDTLEGDTPAFVCELTERILSQAQHQNSMCLYFSLEQSLTSATVIAIVPPILQSTSRIA
jgi:hypothetical protein